MTDRRLVPVSATKLDVWQQCAFRFWLQYVQKSGSRGDWAHLSMGNAVHAALRDWFDLDSPDPAAAAELVQTHWSSLGFRDEEQSGAWRSIAAGWVRDYVEQHPAPVPFSRERTLGALGEYVTVSGRIDRIDERGAELVIVDYKTGRTVPTDDDAKVSRALAIYALVTQRSLRRRAYEVQLHHLPSGTVATHRHTDESLARQMSRVDAIGRDIAVALAAGRQSDFPASPGPLCGWCDFREGCPHRAAVPAQPPWAGLPGAPDDPDDVSSAADSFPI